MPKQSVPAAGSGLPKDQTKSCPVAALAREVKALDKAYANLDAKSGQLAGAADTENDARMASLDDQRKFIEAQATHLLTQSGLGAIFQVQMILNNAETIESWVPEDKAAAKRCAEMLKGIRRMSYSLVAFIEATTGAKAEDTACDYYMPRDGNPHVCLASAMAA